VCVCICAKTTPASKNHKPRVPFSNLLKEVFALPPPARKQEEEEECIEFIAGRPRLLRSKRRVFVFAACAN